MVIWGMTVENGEKYFVSSAVSQREKTLIAHRPFSE
jgi:hypothetical protein